MPEGDTLRRLAGRINARFAGHRITRSVTRDPRIATVELRDRVVQDADAYGKHLFVRFDDGRSLHAHLLMTGSFDIGSPSREPQWKRRVELWLDNGRLTGISVPLLDVIATADEHTITDPLGPDLCATAGPPDIQAVTTRLAREAAAPIAGALLDQRNVAGFGNLYAIEVPFIAGVSPNQPVGTIEGLEHLVGVGTALIRTNAERGPQNTTGRRLPTADQWIYGRRGRPCPLCATTLDGWEERESPWRRVSVWCPSCQRLGATSTVDTERITKLLALHPARRQLSFPKS